MTSFYGPGADQIGLSAVKVKGCFAKTHAFQIQFDKKKSIDPIKTHGSENVNIKKWKKFAMKKM